MTDLDTSRFEVLEEETHFPVTHPQSIGKKMAENEGNEASENLVEGETLEQQLARLMLTVQLDDGFEAPSDIAENRTENVKKASTAKELGNKCVMHCVYISILAVGYNKYVN